MKKEPPVYKPGRASDKTWRARQRTGIPEIDSAEPPTYSCQHFHNSLIPCRQGCHDLKKRKKKQ